jgi:ribosome-binding factor A
MSTRNVRVNELIRREISDFLHTRMQVQMTLITITDVDVSNDHRNARVYFSVIGDADAQTEAEKFLKGHAGMIRGELGRRIVLKYLPKLEFHFDPSLERGNRLIKILDDLENSEKDA